MSNIPNLNKPTGSATFNFLPGTISAQGGIDFMVIEGTGDFAFQISHELATRVITKRSSTSLESAYDLDLAEFDDSLDHMAWWSNARYKGCKATGKAVNKFTPRTEAGGIGFSIIGDNGILPKDLTKNNAVFTVGLDAKNIVVYEGDQTFGLNPVIQNETTAIYVSYNIVAGKGEDENFATIQNYSYVGIQKILIVDIESDTVQILDRSTEGYEEFHRYITNDLPTGGAFSARVLDDSVSSNLKTKYYSKMNKGWLLKTFDFRHAGEFSGSRLAKGEDHLDTNNSMYFYRDGLEEENRYFQGSENDFAEEKPQLPVSGARFRYATIDMFAGNAANGRGDIFAQSHMGPSFTSSSILSNKYTRQFYSGSYGIIENRFHIGSTNAERLANSDLGIASRFIGINCLDFLQANNSNPNLTEEEKTELHITFLEGVKDFSISVSGSGEAPNYSFNDSANDERSIGTFEVDQNQTSLDIGDHCHAFLPQTHEVLFKGAGDTRFLPASGIIANTSSPNPNQHFFERFDNAYLEYTGSFLTFAEKQALAAQGKSYVGCAAIGEVDTNKHLQSGTNLSRIDDAMVYIQGGALGPVGHKNSLTSSNANYNISISSSMTADNYYGGYLNSEGSSSLDWQLSFLDKDHVIIADINKDEELFDGIGSDGVILIPEHTHERVKRNIDVYLEKAGLIPNSPGGLQNVLIE